MIRFVVYLVLLGSVLYLLSAWGKRRPEGLLQGASGLGKPKPPLRAKPNPREIWVQVYETATLDEARRYQARIQEDDIDCIIYEQGKKDIHGNLLNGIGIAVPKTALALAQSIITRLSI